MVGNTNWGEECVQDIGGKAKKKMATIKVKVKLSP
jgi:hypothetical protein